MSVDGDGRKVEEGRGGLDLLRNEVRTGWCGRAGMAGYGGC